MMQKFTLQQATEVLQSGDLKTARFMFSTAAKQNPDEWYAWFSLASIASKEGRNLEAMAYLYRAGNLAPQKSEIWNNLGTILRQEHHTDKAKTVFMRGLEISPEDADLYSNLATLHVNQGNPQEGIDLATKALELNPDHTNARWNRSLLDLEVGNLSRGWDDYREGFKTGERPVRWPSWPRFDPAEHRGARVLVYGEQGLGDEVMFMSLIPDLLAVARSVIVECHPRLETLVRRTWPQVTVHPTRKKDYIEWEDEFDCVTTYPDLCRYYRRTPEHFPRAPYLKVDHGMAGDIRFRLEERLGNGPYIGLGWRGGYKHTRRDLRSLTLEEMMPIILAATESGAKLVSFQYDDEAESDIVEFSRRFKIPIAHMPDLVCGKDTDYMKTAALLECMALNINVNGSLCHLAGATGNELWTLTPHGHAWRYWSPDDRMLWYSSVKMYTAEDNHTWTNIVHQVADDLETRLSLISPGAKHGKTHL